MIFWVIYARRLEVNGYLFLHTVHAGLLHYRSPAGMRVRTA